MKKIFIITFFFLAFSASAHTFTANGNAQIDTAQSKFGGASGLSDGTGDWIQAPDSEDWNVGSGNFTYEWFVRFNSQAVTVTMVKQAQGSTNLATILTNSGAGDLQFLISCDGTTAWCINQSWADVVLNNNQWYHVALVRNGNTGTLYIDGTAQSPTVDMTGLSIFNSTDVMQIMGATGDGTVNGWMDEVRFSKGVARYTANFTPPTAEFGCGQDANTVLLLHMNGTDTSTTFTDDSVTACVAAGTDSGEGIMLQLFRLFIPLTYAHTP